jgi:hypothetical protein
MGGIGGLLLWNIPEFEERDNVFVVPDDLVVDALELSASTEIKKNDNDFDWFEIY